MTMPVPFSGAFSWKRLQMAIQKWDIPNLDFPQEHIETIPRSTGHVVQDLADFPFIFSQICIAYISRTKPYFENRALWLFIIYPPLASYKNVNKSA